MSYSISGDDDRRNEYLAINLEATEVAGIAGGLIAAGFSIEILNEVTGRSMRLPMLSDHALPRLIEAATP